MPLASMNDVGVKQEPQDLPSSFGSGHTYKYTLPSKLMALEQGDGARFLQETSFSIVRTPTYPPPCSPIDCEMQEYQRQYNSVKLKVNPINRNVKIMGILSLVSLAIVFVWSLLTVQLI